MRKAIAIAGPTLTWSPCGSRPRGSVRSGRIAGPLIASAGDGEGSLKAALEAALDVLRARGTSQLSAATATAVLQASIRAAALRAEFFDRIPPGHALAGKPVLAGALDVMLTTLLQPPGRRAAWRLGRADTVVGVVQIAFGELARQGASPERVAVLDTFLRAQATEIEAGKAWDLDTFATRARAALGG